MKILHLVTGNKLGGVAPATWLPDPIHRVAITDLIAWLS